MMYNGIYFGTVIRNSDIVYGEEGIPVIPAGKVLVKVDGITFTDKQFEEYNFPLGNNINGGVRPENLALLESTGILCDVAYSVIGNDGVGVFNSKTGEATISESSDSTMWSESENHGYAPAFMFQSELADAYGGTVDNYGTASVNTNALAYGTDYRSNQARGNFSLPGVGSRVLVQFINGNFSQPVITHVVHSTTSFAGIFDVGGNVYPGIPNVSDVYAYSTQAGNLNNND